jgi:hypothetical protein
MGTAAPTKKQKQNEQEQTGKRRDPNGLPKAVHSLTLAFPWAKVYVLPA